MPAMLQYAYQIEVERRGRRYTDNAATRQHIASVARWLTSEDTRFGLLIYGTIGNGKTTLLNAIQRTINILYDSAFQSQQHAVLSVSALDVAKRARDDNGSLDALKTCPLLHIDDIGCEPATMKVWGNEVSPITEILYARYDRQLYTVCTSNLSLVDIEHRYGSRIADRFREMFDTIAFEEESFR